MYCAQPAMLRRANTAAIAREIFFIEATPVTTTECYYVTRLHVLKI
jgi:hypothetical protein